MLQPLSSLWSRDEEGGECGEEERTVVRERKLGQKFTQESYQGLSRTVGNPQGDGRGASAVREDVSGSVL